MIDGGGRMLNLDLRILRMILLMRGCMVRTRLMCGLTPLWALAGGLRNVLR